MAQARGLRGLRNPVVVAAFGGWNDASEAATGVIDHLAEKYSAELQFAVDPEDYYDFQVNRPTTRLVDGTRILEWPTTEVLVASLPTRDLVLIGGPEPNYHWQQFVASLLSMVRTVQPEIVVLLGAMLTDAPHTRPVPINGTAGTKQLADELGLDLSDYEGPTGIIGVLAAECDGIGIPVVSLWASVPHYVAEPPNPKATLALLAQVEDILNLPIDFGDLGEQADEWVNQVNELVSDDPDITSYITALEERRDEAAPNGEAIAAEFERYLRRRDRRRG
ncbi:putative ATP-grasp superfamily ATP-dependent carboligase [Propionicimonas paludicola]|uniref:Putative ATP-grasp superfamily ATP-dependent carboligase n=1 Tax=Propionicimonas paludicola TaxID=185243 RepID=A0A2A9CRJ1_9ACTN|nr:PAC2 family protein [Propionicimonas paludicola]PFG16705.1 putative ATP-grasp superfamily ATP-dependent carboligase [Propionicimonas paludicola]